MVYKEDPFQKIVNVGWGRKLLIVINASIDNAGPVDIDFFVRLRLMGPPVTTPFIGFLPGDSEHYPVASPPRPPVFPPDLSNPIQLWRDDAHLTGSTSFQTWIINAHRINRSFDLQLAGDPEPGNNRNATVSARLYNHATLIRNNLGSALFGDIIVQEAPGAPSHISAGSHSEGAQWFQPTTILTISFDKLTRSLSVVKTVP